MTIEQRLLVTEIDPRVLPGKHRSALVGFSPEPVRFRVRLDLDRGYIQHKANPALFRESDDYATSYQSARNLLNACQSFVRETRIERDGWDVMTYEFPLKKLMLASPIVSARNVVRPPWMKAAVDVTGSLSSYHVAKALSEVYAILRRKMMPHPEIRMPRGVILGGDDVERAYLARRLCEQPSGRYYVSQNAARIVVDAIRESAFVQRDGGAARLLRNMEQMIACRFEEIAEEYARISRKSAIVSIGAFEGVPYDTVIGLDFSEATVASSQAWQHARVRVLCPQGSLDARVQFIQAFMERALR